MAASPGGRGGATVLEMAKKTLPYFGGKVTETFSLPGFYENFDHVKGITNEDLKLELQNKTQVVKGKILQELLHPNLN